jgi:hypothetical protein
LSAAGFASMGRGNQTPVPKAFSCPAWNRAAGHCRGSQIAVVFSRVWNRAVGLSHNWLRVADRFPHWGVVAAASSVAVTGVADSDRDDAAVVR